jgi:hypothetical protein
MQFKNYFSQGDNSMFRTIIVSAMNEPPESKINDRLARLGERWEIVYARTDANVASFWESSGTGAGGMHVTAGFPKMIVYTATIVLKKKG